MKRAQGGFTLVELMIVVAIMGILTSAFRNSLKVGRLWENMRAPLENLARQERLTALLRPDAREARSVQVAKDGQSLTFVGRAGGKTVYSFSQGRLSRLASKGSSKLQSAALSSFSCSVKNGPRGAQLLTLSYALAPGAKASLPLLELVQP